MKKLDGLRDTQLLARVNHVGVFDLVLVGFIDFGPALGIAIELLGNFTQAVALFSFRLSLRFLLSKMMYQYAPTKLELKRKTSVAHRVMLVKTASCLASGARHDFARECGTGSGVYRRVRARSSAGQEPV